MSSYEQEFVSMFAGLEKQLENIDNPRHRAILKNYRRHGLLEVSGRYQELLAPDMTGEHPALPAARGWPVARPRRDGPGDGVLRVTVAANALVMWVGEQDIAVNDHGFSGEVVFNAFVPAPMLGDNPFGNVRAGADADEIYLLRRTLAFVWPYDERARLIGEHVYEDGASREIIEPDPADVITAERAAQLRAPEIDKVLP